MTTRNTAAAALTYQLLLDAAGAWPDGVATQSIPTLAITPAAWPGPTLSWRAR